LQETNDETIYTWAVFPGARRNPVRLRLGAAHAGSHPARQCIPGIDQSAAAGRDRQGFFAQRKLTIQIQNTPNSDEQRAGLAAGKFEIAHAAVDNAVAMVEAAKEDVIIVSGGDASMNEFMVRPEIRSIADIRGKVLAVDAPNTAYALVAKKILKNNGLVENRDYTVRPVGGTGPRSAAMASNPQLVAGMVNPPFAIAIREKGLKSLGTQFSFIGPYQATGAFVMRKWAAANPALLEHYLAAYIEGQRYAMNPANRAEMIQLLARSFKLSPPVAEGTYQALTSPGSGLAPDAGLNKDGFMAVLAIRAEMEGMWGGKPPSPDKFLDLSYYERALAMTR
jgi:ABC-type nitrate/sulfonate/bicarbonate transport system substrate-binding protein